MTKFWLAAVAATGIFMSAYAVGPAYADDPDFITFGAGYFDFNRKKDEGGEFRLEYRSDYKFWQIKPFVAAAGASSGHGFIGAGILMDVFFGRRFVVTPSIAPHFYFGGDDDLDLDYPLEFRSQIEFAYRFDDRSRLGLAISHYSNASLGDSNPGTESLTVNYSVPVDTIF
ncbi:MAG: acyloxyacyl hydrolase [Rhodospirillales bacterium]|nr:acyloxyacyl hydrolase [Rhodospirillales bacterium]